MVAFQLLNKSSLTQKDNASTAIRNNWNRLYRRDSFFTYTDATLVLPKKSRK